MGAGGAGSGGNSSSSRERAIGRQYSGPSGTTGKEKSTGEKIADTVKTVVSNLPSVRAVKAVTQAVRRGRVNTSLMGTSDYQGSTTRSSVGDTGRGGDGGGAIGTSGQVVQAPTVTSPTTAEVSQSAAAQAQEDITLRKKKILAKGRSPTIMTSPKGTVTGSLTLGKPSLLGR